MALVHCLKAAGVQHIFSVSGGPLNPIYHACSVLDLPLIHTRHEAAACFMAEAAGRLTRTPGVAAVTLGPGVTNTITPALVASMAGTPLLIIGAQAPTHTFERGAGMSCDPLPILSSITKWSARCLSVDRIPEYLEIAWRKMWAGTPGPVFLEVPIDVLSAEVEDPERGARKFTSVGRLAGPAATREQAEAFVDTLSALKRPLMILGDGVFWDAPGNLTEIIERHGIPFVTMRLARGLVDETHMLWAGPGYVPCNATLRRALAEADGILLMGHHFEFDLGFGNNVGEGAQIIQVTSDAGLLNRNRHADLAINAAPANVMELLKDARKACVDTEWVSHLIADWNAERDAQCSNTGTGPLHPVKAVDAVMSITPDDAIFVTSHGNVDFWADARLRLRRPARYLRAGQSGALGAELPYAVGARFADPGAPVILFVGDGGIGYHISELDTAERYSSPIIVVVLDDEKWGAIALPQDLQYGDTYEMALPRRDWVRVAEGLGCNGVFARGIDELQDAIQRALASNKPTLVQVPVASVLSPYMEFISR